MKRTCDFHCDELNKYSEHRTYCCKGDLCNRGSTFQITNSVLVLVLCKMFIWFSKLWFVVIEPQQFYGRHVQRQSPFFVWSNKMFSHHEWTQSSSIALVLIILSMALSSHTNFNLIAICLFHCMWCIFKCEPLHRFSGIFTFSLKDWTTICIKILIRADVWYTKQNKRVSTNF